MSRNEMRRKKLFTSQHDCEYLTKLDFLPSKKRRSNLLLSHPARKRISGLHKTKIASFSETNELGSGKV